MIPISSVVDLCIAQTGDAYVFGAEAAPTDPNPAVFDCSELIEWACRRVGVSPIMPDGSWFQYQHCQRNGVSITPADALKIRGALLFRFSSNPLALVRPTSAHVAMSLGDGRTIEARSRTAGVGVFGGAASRTWTHAGQIPGVVYRITASNEAWPSWATEAIRLVLDRGLMTLDAGRFDPGRAVNRAELAVILARLLKQ
jgi:cell wall-associated NlpC family hydrolase